ncbi:FAD-dependent monooxygenase [Vibrio splendidus]
MEQQRLKVAIIGAGLNGLALALSLRKFGIKAPNIRKGSTTTC